MENKQNPEQEEILQQDFLTDAEPEQMPAAETSVDSYVPRFLSEESQADPNVVPHDMLEHPELSEEITPNEHAMAWHGMTHPSEPEPPFDMSILDHPDYADETEEAVMEPSPVSDEEMPEDSVIPEPEPVYDPEETDFLEEPEPDLYEQEMALREQELRSEYNSEDSFDEIFTAPETESTIPAHDRPARKGRPKRKKGEFLFGIPQLAVTAVWLAVILIVGVTLGRMLWVCAADVLAFGREPKEVTVTIYETDTIDEITEKLHRGGLIRYPGLFKLYADLAVDEGEIRPGIWDLNTMYDYHALVNMMSPSSSREEVQILIPEGYTCRQIFQLLEENKVCTAQDIASYAASGELDDYWFLEDVTRGEENCLEGFLFPDTYKFYKNDSPRAVLQKMLDNFDYRFTEEMRYAIADLNDELGSDFEIRDVVIVASLIEKETSSNTESPLIASVIYNRLFDWGSNPAYLNIDAAIVYALDGKTDLTAEDLKVDSPYNTYLNTGLTPGAISNPGLASLRAALYPEESNYYFYVLDPALGEHRFSASYDEHQAIIASLE